MIQSDESVSGTCEQTYFNPGNLTLASSGQDAENTVKNSFSSFVLSFLAGVFFVCPPRVLLVVEGEGVVLGPSCYLEHVEMFALRDRNRRTLSL